MNLITTSERYIALNTRESRIQKNKHIVSLTKKVTTYKIGGVIPILIRTKTEQFYG